tara:strand:+ start:241 stop:2376 length:2136 start_codon:yes stop_codon:yes gene_type:complete
MGKKLNIYLCDLTYDTIILVSDTIPINIGFIGSYLKKQFGELVDIKLFKYPNEAIDEIKKNPPDILALSNYSWNSNLSEYVASFAKKINSRTITVQGGTNFPHETELQKKFLLNRPSTDIYTILEGEKSCAKIVSKLLESKHDPLSILKSPIDGCALIKPNTRKKSDPVFLKGKILDRIKDLDEIPSPYLNGMLDKFFDGRLTPFIETNRGCPFTCSFCHTGANYFHKLNKFSEDRVREEIEYIGKKCGELGITNLHMADVNFGMYPQDRKTCEFLVESKLKNNWPLEIMATTGKNSKKRVIEITNLLGDMFSINMSMQSMDDNVLKNIKRENIKLDHMLEVNKHLRESGRSTKAELILPLPGESKDTFIDGLNNILNSNASSVTIYTLMMLNGTEFKNPNFRKKYLYEGRYRIVPLNFGQYNNERIFDFEEVGISTKDMSFQDYLFLRALALLVESLHNGRPFYEFFKYARTFGIQPATLLKTMYDNIAQSSKKIQTIMSEFIEETQGELWNSEEELVSFYKKDENYKKLKEGKVGGNLIYKYKSKNLVEAGKDWIDFFEGQVFQIVKKMNFDQVSLNEIKNELFEISKFCKFKLNGLLNIKSNTDSISEEFNYNLMEWIDNEESELKLDKFKFKNGNKKFYFEFTSDQLSVRKDIFKRYGTDINALSKIVTRISNLEGQFRKIRYDEDRYLRDIYKQVGENFIKYALSN